MAENVTTPKRPQPRDPAPATAPDDVSITGSRRAPAEHALERSTQENAAPLETFEQSPERGTDDARMQQDVVDGARSSERS